MSIGHSEIDVLQKGRVLGGALIDELEQAIQHADGWADNCRLAEETAWCIWPGQSDDGLKHAFPGDEEPPFPWENSSDTRIRLAAEKVRECVKVALAVKRRGMVSIQGTEGFDFQRARQAQLLLDWQMRTQIPNAARECNLWVNWAWLYGWSIMGLGWTRAEARCRRRVSREDVLALLLVRTGAEIENVEERRVAEEEMAQAFQTAVLEDTGDGWLEEWLMTLFPGITQKKMARKYAKALRERGEAHVPELRTVADHPEWRAYRPFEHVFLPAEADHTGTARWMGTREWLSRSEVEARAAEKDWDASFVEELWNHAGAASTYSLDNYSASAAYGRTRWNGHRRSAFAYEYDRKGLYEVMTFRHRAVDDEGVTGIYETVLSPHVKGSMAAEDEYLVASQELIDEGTAMLPGIDYTIWDEERPLVESEGLPLWIHTYQQEKKNLRDNEQNYAAISIMPPVRRHVRDMNIPLIIGPDMPLYESQAGSTEWMKPPQNLTAVSQKLQRDIEREANRFTGQPDAEVPDMIVQLNQEHLTDQFGTPYAELLRRTLQLDQLYLPETTVTRVTAAEGEPFRISREEIQGQFDVAVAFDPAVLDPDKAQKKFEAVRQIATSLDRNQITDSNALVKLGYQMIDPAWANLLVRSDEQGSEMELRETKDAIGDIVSGQEPTFTDRMNATMRLQYLNGQLQSNPVLRGIAVDEGDPRNEMLMKYRDHLEFVYGQQQIRPQEGRVGVSLEG
ncbi:MAG: hypothetical protein AAGJ81_10675 [Verrucomicrobiota bacterium]